MPSVAEVGEASLNARADGVRAVPGEAEAAPGEAEFVALYRSRFSDLAGQLYGFTGDAGTAHDLVQEAFVRAWQRWEVVGRYADPAGWVRRVAWNLACSRFRRLRLSRRWAQRERPPEPAAAVGPDRVALVAALRTLPERQRRAVVLRYLADLPIAEIAEECGVAEGTVKSWLHRGRAALAARLADVPEEGER